MDQIQSESNNKSLKNWQNVCKHSSPEIMMIYFSNITLYNDDLCNDLFIFMMIYFSNVTFGKNL